MAGIDQRTSGFILVAVLLFMLITKIFFAGNGKNNLNKSAGPVFAHVMNNFMLIFCGVYVSIVQISRLPSDVFLGALKLPPAAVITGTILCAIALLFFIASLAAMGKNFQLAGTTPREGDVLVTNGPYRFIRHPLYLAGFLFVFGMALVFESAYLLILLAPYALTLLWLVAFEESHMELIYGKVFLEYRRKTGKLLPRFGAARSHVTEALAEVFLLSMKDDPMYRCMFPEYSQQKKYLGRFWKALVGYSFTNGDVQFDPDCNGVACWLPPGKASFTFLRLAKSGFLFPLSVMRFPRLARSRAMGIFSYLEKMQEETIRESHWYLMAIGVHPDAQNRGIGRSLINPVLRQADREGFTCYLETETEKNVSFYRKLGFEVRSEFTVPGTGLKYYAMIRTPDKY